MSELVQVVVEEIERETAEVLSLSLAARAGGCLPSYESGAHVDLHLPGGLVRQYSLCEAPGRFDRYRIAVKLEARSRGGSRAVHELLQPGDTISISHPRNNFPLDRSATHVVLLAGGIGITPLLSMARDLDRHGASFELHYFTRSPEVTAFRSAIAQSTLASRTTHHFGLDAGGVAGKLVAILAGLRPGTHVYVCGPGAFIDAVVASTKDHAPDAAVHLERFSAEPPAVVEGSESFEVHLARAGRSFVVPPELTIAEVLVENGVEVALSCEQGICGTCITAVLEGEPDHHDHYLSDEEHRRGDRMAICVSRCKGRRLVLDI